jgi:hypothetical protein
MMKMKISCAFGYQFLDCLLQSHLLYKNAVFAFLRSSCVLSYMLSPLSFAPLHSFLALSLYADLFYRPDDRALRRHTHLSLHAGFFDAG